MRERVVPATRESGEELQVRLAKEARSRADDLSTLADSHAQGDSARSARAEEARKMEMEAAFWRKAAEWIERGGDA
jgi:hypothetical protein